MKSTNRWKEIVNVLGWSAVPLTFIPIVIGEVRNKGGINASSALMLLMLICVLCSAGAGLFHKPRPLLADACLGLTGLTLFAMAGVLHAGTPSSTHNFGTLAVPLMLAIFGTCVFALALVRGLRGSTGEDT